MDPVIEDGKFPIENGDIPGIRYVSLPEGISNSFKIQHMNLK